jgi:hypothetical protein
VDDEGIPREVWLAAIRDRVERAEEHLDAIKRGLIAYYESEPGSVRGKFDPDASEGEWQVKVQPMPPRLNTLIGEFLHDLRSALNHLARQLVLEHAGKAPRETEFPILTRKPTAKKEGKEALPNIRGGASQTARRLIALFQPYMFGERWQDHPMRVLDKLWNIDKHRDILARGGYFQARFRSVETSFTYTSRLESADEYEARLTLVPDDPSVNVNAEATLKVTLSEPELSQDLQLLGVLEQILKMVKELVSAALETCFPDAGT